jgi:hypothetical protein
MRRACRKVLNPLIAWKMAGLPHPEEPIVSLLEAGQSLHISGECRRDISGVSQADDLNVSISYSKSKDRALFSHLPLFLDARLAIAKGFLLFFPRCYVTSIDAENKV